MSKTFDAVVIGLGATGSAALYHLARRGLRVAGLERAMPGHEGGSSHGESRIIRMAYFEHPSYVPLVRAAYRNWRALEAASGQAVITTTGILETGHPGSNMVRSTLASAVEHGLPHEVLGGRAASVRFPAFDLPADWEAVFQPDAGILAADKAIQLHVEGARTAGADVRTGATVAGIDPRPASVRVTMSDGSTLEAGTVVVSAGGWIGELIPELASHLTLTRQVVGWFQPREPALTGADRFPVFLLDTDAHDNAPGDVLYGFPDFAGTGVKAASHNHGRVLSSAGAARQDADEAEVHAVRAALQRLIPAAAGPVRQVKTCIYTSTVDEHFVVDRHPDDPRIVLASACSGHGFKFASVLGEILADLATGQEVQHEISRFAISRLHHPA